MRFLIDTHILLWALSGSSNLKTSHLELIKNENNTILISIATLWELQIKESINKVKLPNDFFHLISKTGYDILPIHINHIKTLKNLAIYHRDPFDRMLIAQAITDNLKLITQDKNILQYDAMTSLIES